MKQQTNCTNTNEECKTEITDFNSKCVVYFNEICHCKRENKVTNTTSLTESCGATYESLSTCYKSKYLIFSKESVLATC
jgi:hypothetical protein